ncbi:unnamed protein product [Sphagnum compactum]
MVVILLPQQAVLESTKLTATEAYYSFAYHRLMGWGYNSQTVVAADAIRGIATLTAGTTTPLTVTGIAGYYLDNQVENAGAAVAVALFGAGVCSVAGANCWGVDTLQSDHLGLNTSTTTGVGLYNEFDFNITSPYTTGAVLAIGPGTWLVQPAGINGISVNTPWGSCGIGPCAPFAKYANGLVVQSGAATTGINIGAANYTVTANVASMPIYMTYYDSSATAQNISFTALGGSFYLGGTTSTVNLDIVKGSLFLPTGQGVQVNNNVLASASATSAFLAPGAGFTTVQVGNGTAQISLNGPVGYGITLPTGTPRYLRLLHGGRRTHIKPRAEDIALIKTKLKDTQAAIILALTIPLLDPADKPTEK